MCFIFCSKALSYQASGCTAAFESLQIRAICNRAFPNLEEGYIIGEDRDASGPRTALVHKVIQPAVMSISKTQLSKKNKKNNKQCLFK